MPYFYEPKTPEFESLKRFRGTLGQNPLKPIKSGLSQENRKEWDPQTQESHRFESRLTADCPGPYLLNDLTNQQVKTQGITRFDSGQYLVQIGT
jgi:hypothetical protein